MIDLEKLKQAIQMVDTIDYGISYLRDKSFAGNPKDVFYLTHYAKEEKFDSVDELIARLKELTQPKHKYKIGDEVWYTWSDEITSSRISDLEIDGYHQPIYSTNTHYHIKEKHLYPTREALIEAQIAYWENLKEIKQSTVCPKCDEKRVADGICWARGCLYFEEDNSYCRKFEGQIKGLSHSANNLKKVCDHEYDVCKKDPIMRYYINVAGNTYYTNTETMESHCQCGVFADFPHSCKCFKCGEFYK